MPESQIYSVLSQLPVVAAFIWFVLRWSKDWRAYLSARNGQMEAAMEKVADKLEKVAERLDARS